MPREFTPGRVRAARWIAVAADLVQITLLPFWLGPEAPVTAVVNVAIDVVVGIVLCVVLRPHWAFAPTFVGEAVPLLDVVPLWTGAVLFVTRGQGGPPGADPLPPPPPAA